MMGNDEEWKTMMAMMNNGRQWWAMMKNERQWLAIMTINEGKRPSKSLRWTIKEIMMNRMNKDKKYRTMMNNEEHV